MTTPRQTQPEDPAIRVRDRRDPHQFTVHNRIIDEWYPIISSPGLALYNLFCRMSVKGEERCWPGLRLMRKHMSMGASTISEYTRLLAWCQLIYILPSAPGSTQTNDYYLLNVPIVTPTLLKQIKNEVQADIDRLTADREKEARKLEKSGFSQAANKERTKKGSSFHRTILRRLTKWQPIQEHWGDNRPTPTIVLPGQLSLFKETDPVDNSQQAVDNPEEGVRPQDHPDPPVEHRDPVVEHRDPPVESPDPAVERVIRPQDQNKKQQQSKTTIQNNKKQQQQQDPSVAAVVVADILDWLGFVGRLKKNETPPTNQLLAWSFYARAEQPGNNPIAIVRNAWQRKDPPPNQWLELANIWLELDDNGRIHLIDAARNAQYSPYLPYTPDIDLSESAAAALERLWKQTDGNCAPASLMPSTEEINQ